MALFVNGLYRTMQLDRNMLQLQAGADTSTFPPLTKTCNSGQYGKQHTLFWQAVTRWHHKHTESLQAQRPTSYFLNYIVQKLFVIMHK